ncbi:MAG: hypothetical protein ABIW82_07720 [Dokdonella sp.]
MFHVDTGVTARMTQLSIRNGSSDAGGGIYNEGTLTLTGDTLSNNSANGGSGTNGDAGSAGGVGGGTGGFGDSGGIGGNGKGGGIYNAGELTLIGTLLSSNLARGGVGGNGGAGGPGGCGGDGMGTGGTSAPAPLLPSPPPIPADSISDAICFNGLEACPQPTSAPMLNHSRRAASQHARRGFR